MTVFAARRAKGDVLRADFVSLEGFRGSYSRQMARKNPRATSDAATLAKGEIQGLGAFAFGALHGIRVPERPKGDSPGLGSFPLGANHDTHGLKRPKGDLSDVGSFPPWSQPRHTCHETLRGGQPRMRICHPRLDLRHTLPQMPPNAPRVTFFATKQLEGDVSRVDSVSFGGFRGTRAEQMT